MKKSIRQIVYHSGLLHQHHKLRNRNALTVVLFHRVLPPNSPEWLGADPEWTVSTDFFKDCLRFFQKHYTVVSFSQVWENYQHHNPLPDHPLLITFDDGWKCNLQHAAPLLQQFHFPAMLFVTTGAIGKSILSWQEALYALWKTNSLDRKKIYEMSNALEIELPYTITREDNYEKLLVKLRSLSPSHRSNIDNLLFKWSNDLPGLPYMLTKEELLELQEKNFYFGTHGINHESLVHLNNSHTELHISRKMLMEIIGNQNPIVCFSPPQGQYNQQTLKSAEKAGYSIACTSRKGLNAIKNRKGFIDLGRININQLALENKDGRLDWSKLASLLFRQPILQN